MSSRHRKFKHRGHHSGAQPHHAKVHRDLGSHVNLYGRPKVSYLSEQSAHDAAARMGLDEPIQVYRCATCHLFHFAKPKKEINHEQ